MQINNLHKLHKFINYIFNKYYLCKFHFRSRRFEKDLKIFFLYLFCVYLFCYFLRCYIRIEIKLFFNFNFNFKKRNKNREALKTGILVNNYCYRY